MIMMMRSSPQRLTSSQPPAASVRRRSLRPRSPRPRPKRWWRSPQLLWASASASQWSDRGHFPPDTYHVAYPERIGNVSRVSRYLAIRATCIQDVSGCIGLWIRILYVSRSLDTLRAPDTSGYIVDTCIEGKLSLFRGKSQPHPRHSMGPRLYLNCRTGVGPMLPDPLHRGMCP